MSKKPKPIGRPTDYHPRYCDMIVDFFADHELTTERVKATGKDDYQQTELVPTEYPTITDFARKINVNRSSISAWANKFPEFSIALKEAKELQQEIIIKCGLMGIYNASFSIFAMKNIAGWRDKSEIEHSGSITWEGLVNDLQGAEARNTRQVQSISCN